MADPGAFEKGGSVRIGLHLINKKREAFKVPLPGKCFERAVGFAVESVELGS